MLQDVIKLIAQLTERFFKMLYNTLLTMTVTDFVASPPRFPFLTIALFLRNMDFGRSNDRGDGVEGFISAEWRVS